MRVGVRSVRTVLRAHNSLMVYTPILNVCSIINEGLLELTVALDHLLRDVSDNNYDKVLVTVV